MEDKYCGHARKHVTRRQFGVAGAAALCVPGSLASTFVKESFQGAPWRAVNIMNFIRAEEPRELINLMEVVEQQMALIKQFAFPATWLLQYDAMVEGTYVDFLKAEMPLDHETGIWFEMNRKICDDAGVAWRGRPDWEWDYHVPVAYAIGYRPEERRKLVDTAMKTHKRVFGRDAKTVASWNLDAITVAHLADHHGIDALGNCRDQLATDGFTIWGAPIAAYYPSRLNAWSPAVEARNQITVPMFRLLGQDPVYYYDKSLSYPDTMEPAWPSGQSQVFVNNFLEMISKGATQKFAYAQLGQENSFGWSSMSAGYMMQMQKLAEVRDQHGLNVETMGATGRRFKASFKTTPTQAQVMLHDPFGKQTKPERTIWYQSRFYRANLHCRGNEFYLRDLHVYSDEFVQPYLIEPVTTHGIEQRLLAVLDGYHWSDDEVRAGRPGKRAQVTFLSYDHDQKQTPLSMAGPVHVREKGSILEVRVPVVGGETLIVVFNERDIYIHIQSATAPKRVGLFFEWAPGRSAFVEASQHQLTYCFREHDYSIHLEDGTASGHRDGCKLISDHSYGMRLLMAQNSSPSRG